MRFFKESKTEFKELDISKISPNPNRPRKTIDMFEITCLAESLRLNGILQPLTVKRKDEGFEVVSGERRLYAARLAGFLTVPCIISPAAEEQSRYISIIENTHRKNLSLFEEAEAISRLIDEFSLSQSEVAERLGMAQSTLSNKLRLLRFSAEERKRITAAGLSERQARALLRITSLSARKNALERIIREEMSSKKAEELVESIVAPPLLNS